MRSSLLGVLFAICACTSSGDDATEATTGGTDVDASTRNQTQDDARNAEQTDGRQPGDGPIADSGGLGSNSDDEPVRDEPVDPRDTPTDDPSTPMGTLDRDARDASTSGPNTEPGTDEPVADEPVADESSNTNAGADSGTDGPSPASPSPNPSVITPVKEKPGDPPPPDRCSPGEVNLTPYPAVIKNCYDWEEEHSGIPNVERVSLRQITLPTPTVAGEPYVLSLGFESGSESNNIELWGADPDCGDVHELVWWGQMHTGEICIEFTPQDNYETLMMAWRAMRGTPGALHQSITFCPDGTCGQYAEGSGATGDGSLQAPIGPYTGAGRISTPGFRFTGSQGWGSWRLRGPTAPQVGDTVPIEHGYFRMQTGEPFSDAWYCPGEGSTFTWLEHDEEDDLGAFDFQSITELARCPDDGGSGSLSYVLADTTLLDMETTVSGLDPDTASTSLIGCYEGVTGAPCHHRMRFEGSPDVDLYAFQVDDGGVSTPQGLVHQIEDAVLMFTMDDGSPQAACVGSGTITFTADDTRVFELQGISDWLSCPGRPSAPSSFSGQLEF